MPLIKTKKDAIEAVNNTFSVEDRIVNSLSRAQKYGLVSRLFKVNKDTHLILQIEHIDAIQNLEEILKIKSNRNDHRSLRSICINGKSRKVSR